MPLTRVVAITGCDSGLGWALAARSAREGLITVAGMYHGTNTPAATALQKLRVYPYPLDVKDSKSILAFKDYVDEVIKADPSNTLYALVNNAGIMTIGDYEWQTQNMIENTINTNLLGAMKVASAFLPDLRRTALQGATSPRLINIASHCGLEPLPGFAAYSASKAGLLAWTKALRIENKRYGLAASAFIPGGFVNSSSIMSTQKMHGMKMLEHFDEEQKMFYERRISALNNYLGAVPLSDFNSVIDPTIVETFMQALTDEAPKEVYKVESWRYMFYYNLLKLPLPENVRHWLIKNFLCFPEE